MSSEATYIVPDKPPFYSSFSLNKQITQFSKKEVADFEKNGAKTSRALRIASKIVSAIAVSIVIVAIISPTITAITHFNQLQFLSSYWTPWVGLGSYLFLSIIQGTLENIALSKVRKHEMTLLLEESMKKHTFHPFSEANLSPFDVERMKSDQLLKNNSSYRKSILANHPQTAERMEHVVEDLNLEAEATGKAVVAARLAQKPDPYMEKEWKYIRNSVKSAKKELYQDHPGRIKKWIQEHFPRLFSHKPILKRIENFQTKIRVIRRLALSNEGTLSKLFEKKLKTLPESDKKAVLEAQLKRYDKIYNQLSSLELLYLKEKEEYQAHFAFLTEEESGKIKKVEEIMKAKETLKGVITFLKEALEECATEKGMLLCDSQALKNLFGLKNALEIIKAIPLVLDTLKQKISKISVESPNPASYAAGSLLLDSNKFLTDYFQDIKTQIEGSPELKEKCPELKEISAWLDKFSLGASATETFSLLDKNETEREEIYGKVLERRKEALESYNKWITEYPENAFQNLLLNKEVIWLGSYLLLPEPFPKDSIEEPAWLTKVAGRIEASIEQLAVAEKELREEVEEWGEKRLDLIHTRLNAIDENISSSERKDNFKKEIASFQKKLEVFNKNYKECATEESYNQLVKKSLLLEKEGNHLVKKIHGKPFTSRLWEKIRNKNSELSKTAEIETFSSTALHLKNIQEVKITDLMKKMDLSVVRTYRFKRIAIEWLALTVLLVVNTFVFSNAWAGFGIMLGTVGIFAGGYLVDWRMQILQAKKKALRMEERLHNPVPKEKEFNFEKEWNKVRSGDLHTAALPGNRPKLRNLKDTAARLGLEGTSRLHSEWMIDPKKELDFPNWSKERQRPSSWKKEEVQVAENKFRIEKASHKKLFENLSSQEDERVKIGLEALESKSQKLAEEKLKLTEELKNISDVQVENILTVFKETFERWGKIHTDRTFVKNMLTLFDRGFERLRKTYADRTLDFLSTHQEKLIGLKKTERTLEDVNEILYLTHQLQLIFSEDKVLSAKEIKTLHAAIQAFEKEKAILDRLHHIAVFEKKYEERRKDLAEGLMLKLNFDRINNAVQGNSRNIAVPSTPVVLDDFEILREGLYKNSLSESEILLRLKDLSGYEKARLYWILPENLRSH